MLAEHMLSLLCVHRVVNEDLIKQTADAMDDRGLLEAGYNYLVIDGMTNTLTQEFFCKFSCNFLVCPSGWFYLVSLAWAAQLSMCLYYLHAFFVHN